MQRELREEILGMIISKSLREYLLSIQKEVTDEDLLETVGAAPVSLEKKKEFFIRCANDMETEDGVRKKAQNTLEELETALFQLYHAKKSDIFLLEYHAFHDAGGLPVDTVKSGCRLTQDFKAAKEHMEQIFYEHMEDWQEQQKGEPSDWYWKLWLADMEHPCFGTAQAKYRFICNAKGEVQYVCQENHYWSILSGGAAGWLKKYTLPVPFLPGDILRIDCRPYAPSDCYCLVLEKGADGIGCLYPASSGRAGVGVIEDGYYYENENRCMQYLPPLFCAERYEGELPGDCAFLKTLSQKIAGKQTAGRALGRQVYDRYYQEPYDRIDRGLVWEGIRWRSDREKWQIKREDCLVQDCSNIGE